MQKSSKEHRQLYASTPTVLVSVNFILPIEYHFTFPPRLPAIEARLLSSGHRVMHELHRADPALTHDAFVKFESSGNFFHFYKNIALLLRIILSMFIRHKTAF